MAVIKRIYAVEGEALIVGAKFLDFTVDLSAAAAHDCPPVSHYRLVLRDRVWLRRLHIAQGQEVAVGATLAGFSSDPDESPDGEPAREVRVTIAGILDTDDWWSQTVR